MATVRLGENGAAFSRSIESLRAMPWQPYIIKGQDNKSFAPVSVRVKGNTLLASTIIGEPDRPTIRVVDNEFTISDPFLDRNSNEHAFEVVTAEGVVIFQMIQKSPTDIALNGIFPIPGGGYVLAGPEGTYTVASSQPIDFKLKPIFKYPSWKFPGQYADSN